MPNQESSNYFEYIINDLDSYRAVLSGANLEISQLQSGRLVGRHVRLGLPGGQFSYVELGLSMRAVGIFPNLWTLSAVLESKGRSLQHGTEVRAGSLFIHGPGAEHDAVYGQDSKIVCFAVPDEVFAKRVRRLSPHLQRALHQPFSVFEPPPTLRGKIIAHFAEAAAIIQSDPRVRNSSQALAKFESEMVCDFLEAVADQLRSDSIGADQRTAAIVQKADQVAQQSSMVGTTVAELSATCKVPRRALNRAFQNALGMGPATYLRRVRLNRARRALQEQRIDSTTVSGVALNLGFWNLGRFAEQYKELFGELPCETLRRKESSQPGPKRVADSPRVGYITANQFPANSMKDDHAPQACERGRR